MVEPNHQCPLCVLLGVWREGWTGESCSGDSTTIYDLISYTVSRYSHLSVIFAGAGVLLLVNIVFDLPFSGYSDTERIQVAKDVIASQDSLS
jgi:hypothetical protein